ncbi:MAG: bacillithiol biosynthesis deacetylase BshB1 [Cyclobacteriaceae bacterium]|jgi:bacillithiol biosynthesis deacetylase BshB1
MKINILAIAAHPDDVELACAGTLISHSERGFKTGVIDLTRGEMGTRGSADERMQEASAAADIMGLSVRENMGFEDSFFINDKEHQLKLVAVIRKYKPDIIITNALFDRHPDHGRGAELVEEAVFKSGLVKIQTTDIEGNIQEAWRPKKIYFSIQSTSLTPDFYVDVTQHHERKIEAIRAYKTQFFNSNSQEPETFISRPEFLDMIESRAQEYGHRIGVKYAEGFQTKQALGVTELYNLV